jgi:hypothetical protein
MAGIDYNILGQIKPIQLESPMNAMAQAMQLRGLQESLQMNALKAQEYRQQQQEKNELAKLMGSGIPYGSDEFFNRLSVKAPSYVEPIASAVEKRRKSESERQTALLTQQQREQATEEAARKSKEARRVTALRGIASATTPDSAYAMMQHYYGQGDLGYDDYQLLAPELLENPDWRATQTNILTRLLPAKEALTAGADIEKAALDVDKAKQDFAKAKFGFTTEQIDTRRKQFDQIYPAISISSEADVEARIRAQAEDPVLGPLIKQFGSVEKLIARDKNEFRNNAPGYKARLSGVPTADILKAAEDRERAAFNQDQLNRVLNKQPLISIDQWRATQRSAQAAPAPDAAAVAPAAAVDSKTVAMPTNVAVTTADGGKQLGQVPVVANVSGVNFLDSTSRALYTLASDPEFKDSAPALRDMADKIHAEHAKRLEEKRAEERKSTTLSGDFINVMVAEDQIAELEKNPTPLNLRKIANLRAQIKAANEGKAPKNYNVIKMPPGPKAVDEKYAQDYLDWTQGGGADAAANSAQIKMVLDRFANGEILSGPSIGLAPDFFNALVNPEALGAKQAVQEVVQRNLRAVLGAQFTQVEGENLVNRAFDPRLKPQENAKRLRKLFLQMQTAANQKQAMAEYYEANETLRGFKGKQPKMQDFFNVLTAPDAPPKGSVDVMVDGKMHRFKSQADLEAYKAKGGKVDK